MRTNSHIPIVASSISYKTRKILVHLAFILITFDIIFRSWQIETQVIHMILILIGIALLYLLLVPLRYFKRGSLQLKDLLISFESEDKRKGECITSDSNAILFYGGYVGIAYFLGFLIRGFIYTEGHNNFLVIKNNESAKVYQLFLKDRKSFEALLDTLKAQNLNKLDVVKDFSGLRYKKYLRQSKHLLVIQTR